MVKKNVFGLLLSSAQCLEFTNSAGATVDVYVLMAPRGIIMIKAPAKGHTALSVSSQ